MLNQGTLSAAGDIQQENPTVAGADEIIISPDTRLGIAEMIGYLADQFLINRPQLARDLNDLLTRSNPQKEQEIGNLTEEEQKWIDNVRNTSMLVAVMIASLTFQAAINPPGGVWEDWKNDPTKSPSPSPTPYEPGEAVNQDMHFKFFISFMFFNGLGLVASLSIILLLTDPRQIKFKWQVWVLLVTMRVCVTSVAVAFIFGIKLIMDDNKFSATTAITFVAMFSGIVFLGNLYRLVRFLNKNDFWQSFLGNFIVWLGF